MIRNSRAELKKQKTDIAAEQANNIEMTDKTVAATEAMNSFSAALVQTLIAEAFSGGEIEDYIDGQRIRAIIESIDRWIEHLAILIQTQNPRMGGSTEDDVEKNIAENYSPRMTL